MSKIKLCFTIYWIYDALRKNVSNKHNQNVIIILCNNELEKC